MDNEPAFPVEMEREIFETTALMHPSTTPALLRVARRTLLWIEPLLYRVSRVGWGPPHSDMARTILRGLDSKPASFFSDAVQYLLVQANVDWSQAEVARVLKACPGVENFAIMGSLATPALLPILANMRLRRLSASLESLFGSSSAVDTARTRPLFTSITHLHLFDGTIEVFSHISALPALTHLCLNNAVPLTVIHALLDECPRLELLINFWGPSTWAHILRMQSRDVPVHDVRFVVGLYELYHWDDWEAGARGRPDVWSAAEDFVARRRSGAIEADCYWLEP
ncbi:hypothetical protein DFH09DRAFT_69243 [Mycena vulgaris]|nr:hypothetical protein DFH09DRAFT_69243 [Mycena vulgaris]